jgi:hypothetical protein
MLDLSLYDDPAMTGIDLSDYAKNQTPSQKVPDGWIGRRPKTPIELLDGGENYLELVRKNKTGRRNFIEEMFDVEAREIPWIGTWADVGHLVGINKIAKKLASGEFVSDQELVDFNSYMAYEQRKRDSTWGSNVVDVIQGSISFGTEIAGAIVLSALFNAPGGMTALSGNIAKQGIKKGLKTSLKTLAKKGIKGVAKENAERLTKNQIKNVLGQVGMRNAMKSVGEAQRVLAKTIGKSTQKLLVPIIKKPAADLTGKLIEIGTNLELKALMIQAIAPDLTARQIAQRQLRNTLSGSDETEMQAVAKAMLDMNIELASEFSGEYLGKAANIIINKFGGKKVQKLIGDMTKSATIQHLSGKYKSATATEAWALLNNVGVNNVLEEMGEERVGDFLRGLLGVEGNASLPNAVANMIPDFRQLTVEAAAFSALPLATAAFGRAAGVPTAQEFAEKIAPVDHLFHPEEGIAAKSEAEMEADAEMLHDLLSQEEEAIYVGVRGFDWLKNIFGDKKRGTLSTMLRRKMGLDIIGLHDAVYNLHKEKSGEDVAKQKAIEAVAEMLQYQQELMFARGISASDADMINEALNNGDLLKHMVGRKAAFFLTKKAVSRKDYLDLQKLTGKVTLIDIKDSSAKIIGRILGEDFVTPWDQLDHETQKVWAYRWGLMDDLPFVRERYELLRKMFETGRLEEIAMSDHVPVMWMGTRRDFLENSSYPVGAHEPVFEKGKTREEDIYVKGAGAVNAEDGSWLNFSSAAQHISLMEDVIEALWKQVYGFYMPSGVRGWVDSDAVRERISQLPANQQTAYEQLISTDRGRFEFMVKAYLYNGLGHREAVPRSLAFLLGHEIPDALAQTMMTILGRDLVEVLAGKDALAMARGQMHQQALDIVEGKKKGKLSDIRRMLKAVEINEDLADLQSLFFGENKLDLRSADARKIVHDALEDLDKKNATFALEDVDLANHVDNTLDELMQAIYDMTVEEYSGIADAGVRRFIRNEMRRRTFKLSPSQRQERWKKVLKTKKPKPEDLTKEIMKYKRMRAETKAFWDAQTLEATDRGVRPRRRKQSVNAPTQYRVSYMSPSVRMQKQNANLTAQLKAVNSQIESIKKILDNKPLTEGVVTYYPGEERKPVPEKTRDRRELTDEMRQQFTQRLKGLEKAKNDLEEELNKVSSGATQIAAIDEEIAQAEKRLKELEGEPARDTDAQVQEARVQQLQERRIALINELEPNRPRRAVFNSYENEINESDEPSNMVTQLQETNPATREARDDSGIPIAEAPLQPEELSYADFAYDFDDIKGAAFGRASLLYKFAPESTKDWYDRLGTEDFDLINEEAAQMIYEEMEENGVPVEESGLTTEDIVVALETSFRRLVSMDNHFRNRNTAYNSGGLVSSPFEEDAEALTLKWLEQRDGIKRTKETGRLDDEENPDMDEDSNRMSGTIDTSTSGFGSGVARAQRELRIDRAVPSPHSKPVAPATMIRAIYPLMGSAASDMFVTTHKKGDPTGLIRFFSNRGYRFHVDNRYHAPMRPDEVEKLYMPRRGERPIIEQRDANAIQHLEKLMEAVYSGENYLEGTEEGETRPATSGIDGFIAVLDHTMEAKMGYPFNRLEQGARKGDFVEDRVEVIGDEAELRKRYGKPIDDLVDAGNINQRADTASPMTPSYFLDLKLGNGVPDTLKTTPLAKSMIIMLLREFDENNKIKRLERNRLIPVVDEQKFKRVTGHTPLEVIAMYVGFPWELFNDQELMRLDEDSLIERVASAVSKESEKKIRDFVSEFRSRRNALEEEQPVTRERTAFEPAPFAEEPKLIDIKVAPQKYEQEPDPYVTLAKNDIEAFSANVVRFFEFMWGRPITDAREVAGLNYLARRDNKIRSQVKAFVELQELRELEQGRKQRREEDKSEMELLLDQFQKQAEVRGLWEVAIQPATSWEESFDRAMAAIGLSEEESISERETKEKWEGDNRFNFKDEVNKILKSAGYRRTLDTTQVSAIKEMLKPYVREWLLRDAVNEHGNGSIWLEQDAKSQAFFPFDGNELTAMVEADHDTRLEYLTRKTMEMSNWMRANGLSEIGVLLSDVEGWTEPKSENEEPRKVMQAPPYAALVRDIIRMAMESKWLETDEIREERAQPAKAKNWVGVTFNERSERNRGRKEEWWELDNPDSTVNDGVIIKSDFPHGRMTVIDAGPGLAEWIGKDFEELQAHSTALGRPLKLVSKRIPPYGQAPYTRFTMFPYRPKHLIGGMQTGAERIAIDVGPRHDLGGGGFVPDDFSDENGPNVIMRKYGGQPVRREVDEEGKPEPTRAVLRRRTEENVRNSDVTIIFHTELKKQIDAYHKLMDESIELWTQAVKKGVESKAGMKLLTAADSKVRQARRVAGMKVLEGEWVLGRGTPIRLGSSQRGWMLQRIAKSDPGTMLTYNFTKKHRKPVLFAASAEEIASFLEMNGADTINVAGPRASADATVRQWGGEMLDYALQMIEQRAGMLELSTPKAAEQGQASEQATDAGIGSSEASGESSGLSEAPINVYYGSWDHRELSNLERRPFVIGERRYQSVEHAYQTNKYQRAGAKNVGDLNDLTKDELRQLARDNGTALKKSMLKSDMIEAVANLLDFQKVFDSELYSDERWLKSGTKLKSKLYQLPERVQMRPVKERLEMMEEFIYQSFKQNPVDLRVLLLTGNRRITHEGPGMSTKDSWRTDFPVLLMKVRDRLREEFSATQATQQNVGTPAPAATSSHTRRTPTGPGVGAPASSAPVAPRGRFIRNVPMGYTIPVEALATGLSIAYPSGTTTGNLIEQGHRIATTRKKFADVGDRVTFQGVSGVWEIKQVIPVDLSDKYARKKWEAREGWSLDWIDNANTPYSNKIKRQIYSPNAVQTIFEQVPTVTAPAAVHAEQRKAVQRIQQQLQGSNQGLGALWEDGKRTGVFTYDKQSRRIVTAKGPKWFRDLVGKPREQILAAVNSHNAKVTVGQEGGTSHALEDVNFDDLSKGQARNAIDEALGGNASHLQRAFNAQLLNEYMGGDEALENYVDDFIAASSRYGGVIQHRHVDPSGVEVDWPFESGARGGDLPKIFDSPKAEAARVFRREVIETVTRIAREHGIQRETAVRDETFDWVDVDDANEYFNLLMSNPRDWVENPNNPFLDRDQRRSMALEEVDWNEHVILPPLLNSDVLMHKILKEASRDMRWNLSNAATKANRLRKKIGMMGENANKLPDEADMFLQLMLMGAKLRLDNPNEDMLITHTVYDMDTQEHFVQSKYDFTITEVFDHWDKIALEFGVANTTEIMRDLEEMFEEAREKANMMMEDFSEAEWIHYLEHYIPHRYKHRRDMAGHIAGFKTIIENTARAKGRKFPTYRAAAKEGWIPSDENPLDLYENWTKSVYLSSRTRYLFNNASVLQNVDGIPVHVPVRTGHFKPHMSAYDDVSIKRIAENFAKAHYIQPTIADLNHPWEYLEKVMQEVADREYGGDIDTMMRELGYVRMETPAMASVSYLWVQAGDSAKVLRHVIERKWDNMAWRAVESFNSWSKYMMLTLSFFHPFALAESLIASFGMHMDNPAMGWKKWREHWTSRNDMLQHMRENPELMEPWIRAGLQVDYAGDPNVQSGIVDRQLQNAIDRFDKPEDDHNKVIAIGLRGFQKLKKKTDTWLWHNFHPSVKIYVAETTKARVEAEQGRPLEPYQYEEIAEYVNDALGGQEWENYLWATPRVRQLLHLIMFAPDWTLSAANISGITRAPLINKLHARPMGEIQKNQMLKEYWPAMVGIVLFGLPNALQALIYAAFGDPDQGDEPFNFMNEPGKRTSVDMTPLLRNLPFYQGGDTGKRRTYFRWGKQAYEVFEGWLAHPVRTAMGKTSAVFRTVWEQVMGTSTGGWDLPFKDKSFIGSLTNVDGSYMDSRIGHVIQKFTPMGILQMMQGRPPTFVAPVSQGATQGKITVEMEKVLMAYAEPTTFDKITGNNPFVESVDVLVRDLVDAAYKNGVNPDNALRNARSKVLSKYYKEFFRAMDKGNERAMNSAAESIVRLHGTVESLERSIRRQRNNSERDLSQSEADLIRQKIERAMNRLEGHEY